MDQTDQMATPPRAAPPGRREVRRAERTERILAAAEQVFAETGFAGATTAAVALRAGVPKATVHYYFSTKEDLYRAVIDRVMVQWTQTGDSITADADPATALSTYVAAKIRVSRTWPLASRIFANEMLHGAPNIEDYLSGGVLRWVEEKGAVLEGWARAGKIAPVNVRHLFFAIWAATQTYADFEPQVRIVLGRRALKPADFEDATRTVTAMVLAVCGLSRPELPAPRAED